MGVYSDSVIGGRQTISTRVTQFAADQARVGAPQGITVEPASSKSLRVSWQPVSGAFAYEVFKRKVGSAGQRQFAGAPLHVYFDGDPSTNGWSHVALAAPLRTRLPMRNHASTSAQKQRPHAIASSTHVSSASVPCWIHAIRASAFWMGFAVCFGAKARLLSALNCKPTSSCGTASTDLCSTISNKTSLET